MHGVDAVIALVPLLRVIKLLAVGALFAGTLGAFVSRDLHDRRVFAYALAGPGFGLSWITGFALGGIEELELLATWVIAAMACSLFSLQVVLYAVGKEGRRSVVAAAMALVPLVATVALMVYRPQ
jgi:hypothetical protein